MEEKILLAELTKNCNEKKEKVMELLETYDLAVLGRKVTDEHEKEISNRVLAEHEFFADQDFYRDPINVKAGDRITDETLDFLMSKEDFERFLKIRHPYLVEAGICDENGYYTQNWSAITCDARNELVKYIVDNIIPEPLAGIFRAQLWSIAIQERIINITKESFGVAV